MTRGSEEALGQELTHTSRRRTRVGRLFANWLPATFLLWLSAVIVSFPLLWTIRSSFMPTGEVMRFPPVWIPSSLTLQNYADVLSRQPFARYLSLIHISEPTRPY